MSVLEYIPLLKIEKVRIIEEKGSSWLEDVLDSKVKKDVIN